MWKFSLSMGELLHNNDNVHMFFSLPSGDALHDHPDGDYIFPGGWHSPMLMRTTFMYSNGCPVFAFKHKRCTPAVSSDDCQWKKAAAVSVKQVYFGVKLSAAASCLVTAGADAISSLWSVAWKNVTCNTQGWVHWWAQYPLGAPEHLDLRASLENGGQFWQMWRWNTKIIWGWLDVIKSAFLSAHFSLKWSSFTFLIPFSYKRVE